MRLREATVSESEAGCWLAEKGKLVTGNCPLATLVKCDTMKSWFSE